MSNEGTQAADELEQLKKRKERAELKAQIAALHAPWWKRAGLVTAVTAIVAAVLPLTKAIEEHYRNEREFVLQQVKQEHDIRMAYLDRFDVPGQRLQTLRFLLATSTDPRLLAWAREEQKVVQGQLDKIERDLMVVVKKIEQSPPGPSLDDLKKQRDELNRLKDATKFVPAPTADSAVR
jgi:hypothetical protein